MIKIIEAGSANTRLKDERIISRQRARLLNGDNSLILWNQGLVNKAILPENRDASKKRKQSDSAIEKEAEKIKKKVAIKAVKDAEKAKKKMEKARPKSSRREKSYHLCVYSFCFYLLFVYITPF